MLSEESWRDIAAPGKNQVTGQSGFFRVLRGGKGDLKLAECVFIVVYILGAADDGNQGSRHNGFPRWILVTILYVAVGKVTELGYQKMHFMQSVRVILR